MLGQGTIYPDTIESGGTKHAAKIKTHHNRVPQIEEMIKKGLIIELSKSFIKMRFEPLEKKLVSKISSSGVIHSWSGSWRPSFVRKKAELPTTGRQLRRK
jgi:hypothetical protein